MKLHLWAKGDARWTCIKCPRVYHVNTDSPEAPTEACPYLSIDLSGVFGMTEMESAAARIILACETSESWKTAVTYDLMTDDFEQLGFLQLLYHKDWLVNFPLSKRSFYVTQNFIERVKTHVSRTLAAQNAYSLDQWLYDHSPDAMSARFSSLAKAFTCSDNNYEPDPSKRCGYEWEGQGGWATCHLTKGHPKRRPGDDDCHEMMNEDGRVYEWFLVDIAN